MTWGTAVGATSYKVERAPDNGSNAPGTWQQLAAGVTGPTYDSTGLSANVKYWYRVRATNVSGDGAYTAPASATTLPNPPGAPTFSSITASSLTVSWTAPTGGASSYDLERGTSATGPWTPLATGTTALSYADSGLTPGTTYWYQVRATNLDGLKSAYASRSTITLPAAPAAPTFSSVGPFTLNVNWGLVTGATTYRLERAPDAAGVAGAWTEIASVTTSPYSPYADSQLSPNTRYWYRLRAANASGNGAYSPERSVMTLPGTPEKPTFSSVTKTSITVSWTAPAGGAASYELQRAPTANGTWMTAVSGTAALTFADANLTAGTTYFYRVRAANADGGYGAWSPVASTWTVPEAPGTPWFNGVSTVSLTVNWDPIPGAMIYQVERSPDVSGAPQPGGWVVRATLSGDTYYNDVGTANTVYWYRVRAVNDGGPGDYSPAASVATLANAPGQPTFSNVTQTSVTVSWTAPSGGAVGYVIERAPAQVGPFAPIQSGVTALSWADTPLSAGTTYWYRIRATNSASATGSPSLAASVTTVPAPPSGAPGAPTFSAIAATSVAIAWTDTSGATSYRLERAPDASSAPGAWTVIATVSVKSYTDRSLAANTRYWYRVRGATAGGDGTYSAESFVITAPNAPGTPSLTSIGTTSIGLAWTEPAGSAAGYELERGTSASGPWGALVAVAGRSHTDTGLAPGTTYWYRVRATNASGVAGAYSAARSADDARHGAGRADLLRGHRDVARAHVERRRGGDAVQRRTLHGLQRRLVTDCLVRRGHVLHEQRADAEHRLLVPDLRGECRGRARPLLSRDDRHDGAGRTRSADLQPDHDEGRHRELDRPVERRGELHARARRELGRTMDHHRERPRSHDPRRHRPRREHDVLVPGARGEHRRARGRPLQRPFRHDGRGHGDSAGDRSWRASLQLRRGDLAARELGHRAERDGVQARARARLDRPVGADRLDRRDQLHRHGPRGEHDVSLPRAWIELRWRWSALR